MNGNKGRKGKFEEEDEQQYNYGYRQYDSDNRQYDIRQQQQDQHNYGKQQQLKRRQLDYNNNRRNNKSRSPINRNYNGYSPKYNGNQKHFYGNQKRFYGNSRSRSNLSSKSRSPYRSYNRRNNNRNNNNRKGYRQNHGGYYNRNSKYNNKYNNSNNNTKNKNSNKNNRYFMSDADKNRCMRYGRKLSAINREIKTYFNKLDNNYCDLVYDMKAALEKLSKLKIIQRKFAHCIDNSMIDRNLMEDNLQLPKIEMINEIYSTINEIKFNTNMFIQMLLTDTFIPCAIAQQITLIDELQNEILELSESKIIKSTNLGINIGKHKDQKEKENENKNEDILHLLAILAERESVIISKSELQDTNKIKNFVNIREDKIEKIKQRECDELKSDTEDIDFDENTSEEDEFFDVKIGARRFTRQFNTISGIKHNNKNLIGWFGTICDSNLIKRWTTKRNNYILNNSLTLEDRNVIINMHSGKLFDLTNDTSITVNNNNNNVKDTMNWNFNQVDHSKLYAKKFRDCQVLIEQLRIDLDAVLLITKEIGCDGNKNMNRIMKEFIQKHESQYKGSFLRDRYNKLIPSLIVGNNSNNNNNNNNRNNGNNQNHNSLNNNSMMGAITNNESINVNTGNIDDSSLSSFHSVNSINGIGFNSGNDNNGNNGSMNNGSQQF